MFLKGVLENYQWYNFLCDGKFILYVLEECYGCFLSLILTQWSIQSISNSWSLNKLNDICMIDVSQQWLPFAGMWCHVIWQRCTDISVNFYQAKWHHILTDCSLHAWLLSYLSPLLQARIIQGFNSDIGVTF